MEDEEYESEKEVKQFETSDLGISDNSKHLVLESVSFKCALLLLLLLLTLSLHI